VKGVIGTFLYAVLSSVVPIFNIEIYLVGLAALVESEDALVLAVAAGLGQAVGKLVWYYWVVRSMDLHLVKRWLESPKRQAQLKRWEDRVAGRPVVGGGATFVSGLIGVPPLLIMGVVAGAVRMNVPLFFSMIVLGRGLQSWLILAGLTSAFH
jgi:membrane protein YqaA with SNARE-associated domain